MKYFSSIFLVWILFCQSACGKSTNDSHNEDLARVDAISEVHDSPIIEIVKDGHIDFYHWFPWKKPKQYVIRQDENGEECKEAHSSINEFPEDIFTQEQRLQGAIIFHFIGAIYFFTFSGLVINYYFIPSVLCICEDLKITPDVGAAVFMATATATPELFINLISTFIAQSDMGLGAVIGSMMWNIMGVAAIASLATRKPVSMDWVPIARDCTMFTINVFLLIGVSWDGVVHWYEALILVLFIVPYYVFMFQSARLSRFLKRKFEVEYGCCGHINKDLDKDHTEKKDGKTLQKKEDEENVVEHVTDADRKKAEDRAAYVLLKTQRLGLRPCPKDTLGRTFFWYYSWPLRVILFCTLPNPKTVRKLYLLTFVLCIVWIGVITYLLFFMLIIISHTFSIPETVMGITVFAIGGCTPELITGFIMARRGQSGTGLANSFGTSSLAIIMCLGAPWLVSALLKLYSDPPSVIEMETNGVRYTIITLLFVPVAVMTIFALFNFKLRKLSGLCLGIAYLTFITFATLVESEILFPSANGC